MEKREYTSLEQSIPTIELESGVRIDLAITRGPIAPSECYKLCPTLSELHMLAPLFQERTGRHEAETGEWTADFIDYGTTKGDAEAAYIEAELIRMPDMITEHKNQWHAEGGSRIPVLLPDDGWVKLSANGLLFDPITGLPYETTWDQSQAHPEMSFFWRGPKGGGLRVINRECERFGYNRLDISTSQQLDFKHHNIGYRNVIRS